MIPSAARPARMERGTAADGQGEPRSPEGGAFADAAG